MTTSTKIVLPEKDPVDAQIRAALKPAEVTLTVTGFKDVLASNTSAESRNTAAGMFVSPHPRVYQDPDKPDTLRIKPKGATIRFTIKPDDYFPIGIAFQLVSGVPDPDTLDRLGTLNFEQAQMPRTPHTLCITDSFKDEDGDNRYKFSVIVQRASDCAIGIIDPGIEHDS